VRKRWIAGPVVVAAPLVLALCLNAAFKPSQTIALSGSTQVMPRFAAPASVGASSVTATWATVRFVLPSADATAGSEEVAVYRVLNGSATVVSSGTINGTGSGVTVTGLRPSTSYIVAVSVNADSGHAASSWVTSPEFATTAATSADATDTPTGTTTPAVNPTLTSTPTPGTSTATSWPAFDVFPSNSPTFGSSIPGTGVSTATSTVAQWPASTAATATTTPPVTSSASASTGTAAVPYAGALASYNVLAQSYSATDIINDGWAQDANDTAEGGETCPVANAAYSSALDAVVLSTGGTPATGATADCGHIRSQYTVPTSGDVVEAEIWLPSLSSAATANGTSYPAGALLDWTSMWTDGAGSTNGTENWPADTEIDAVETQYGANYVSVHYGSAGASGGSTGNWTTAPTGWGPAGTSYATPNAGVANVAPGWNVVDIEFTATDANIYVNGGLYVTIPGSVLSHDPAYLDFGISGPNGNDSNYPTWPAGPATEDVAYVKVFS